jgi:hypothetical protein
MLGPPACGPRRRPRPSSKLIRQRPMRLRSHEQASPSIGEKNPKMVRLKREVIGAALTLVLVACSGSNANNGGAGGGGDGGSAPDNQGTSTPACGEVGRTGETDCKSGGTTCATGTYCNAGNNSGVCPLGCTSDRNCAANQHCIFEANDGQVGICRTCGDGPVDAAPVSSCAASPHDDASCVAPGKAFSCNSPNESPQGQTCNAVSGRIGLFCCGGEANPCHRNSFEDPLCSGAQAYDCPPDADAPSACKASHGPPSAYCCAF